MSPRRTPCHCHQSCRNIDHLLVGLPLVAHLQTQVSLGCNQVRSLCLNPRMSYSRAMNFLVSASGWVSYCDKLPKCIELVKMFIWVFPYLNELFGQLSVIRGNRISGNQFTFFLKCLLIYDSSKIKTLQRF